MPTRIGPYRLEKLLGVGGMGEVYRAYDERLDRQVALKQVRPDRLSEPRARRRFLREARLAAQLNHPALLHVHDILERDDGDWIVMELVEGEPLDKALQQGLTADERFSLAVDIASGLAVAHAAGVLHRDLKSENFMVTPSGHAKILDFGLAKSVARNDESTLTADGAILGTPWAMSPEQAEGRPVDARSDLFSLGVLFYEIFGGTSPFRSGRGPIETLARVRLMPHEPILTHAPGLPLALSDLIDRLLAKDPEDRPQSAEDVVEDLRRILGSEPDVFGFDPRSDEEETRREDLGDALTPLQVAVSPLSGEKRQLTVLCCGLVDDGHSASSLDPDTLSEILPVFQPMATESIDRHGGHLGQVEGHQLIVYFGYPQAHRDLAGRAVRCALEIVEKVLDAVGDHGVSVRAGVHTGPVVVLAARPEAGHRERLILGRTLDLTTELQRSAEPGEVRVSAMTNRLIRGLFVERPAGEIQLSRVDETVPVYRVLASRDLSAPPYDEADSSPFLGRQKEVELLLDRFQLAREGTGQTVLVRGAAGLGKSRLLQVVRERLIAQGALWLAGCGSSSARHRAFQSLPQWLLQLLELAPEDSLERRRARLDAVLQEIEFPVGEVLEPLARLLEPSFAGRELSDGERETIVEVLPALILELAERRPAVLACEDLQWVDPATLEVLGHLVDQSAAAPILLFLTYRPGFQCPWGFRSHVTQLQLGPLAGREVDALIDLLARDRELSRTIRRQIAERADGVPRFVEELVKEAGADRSADDVEEWVPMTLRDALTARLDRLGSARDVARMASVLGREFAHGDLAALSALDVPTLNHSLERLLDAGLIERRETSPEPSYRFRLALERDVAYESLLEEDCRRLQRLLAGSAEPGVS